MAPTRVCWHYLRGANIRVDNNHVRFYTSQRMHPSTIRTRDCDRAAKQNDAVQVYFKLIDIYTRAGEKKNALSLCNEATKKFKKRVAVWELYMQMLLIQSKTDEARVALRRALTVLDKKKHVLMMSKFAILEYVTLVVLK